MGWLPSGPAGCCDCQSAACVYGRFLGGSGVTDETIVARIFSDIRAFRIHDGPSEVHRWSIGNRIVRAT